MRINWRKKVSLNHLSYALLAMAWIFYGASELTSGDLLAYRLSQIGVWLGAAVCIFPVIHRRGRWELPLILGLLTVMMTPVFVVE